jgi:hypothetical protein
VHDGYSSEFKANKGGAYFSAPPPQQQPGTKSSPPIAARSLQHILAIGVIGGKTSLFAYFVCVTLVIIQHDWSLDGHPARLDDSSLANHRESSMKACQPDPCILFLVSLSFF